jgi:hypothetical protein
VLKKQDQWLLEFSEVKSSQTGEDSLLRGQQRRLFAAANFIAGLMGMTVRFTRIVGQDTFAKGQEFH